MITRRNKADRWILPMLTRRKTETMTLIIFVFSFNSKNSNFDLKIFFMNGAGTRTNSQIYVPSRVISFDDENKNTLC